LLIYYISEQGRKSATACAIEAGYAKESARQAASKLQNPKLYPLVVQYIGELRDEWQKQYEVTFGNHIAELGKLRDEAREKKAWSAAVNAEVARGKAAGLYIEQKIIRTGKLEDLSTEELESRMKQIIDDYSPILEGIEFEELKEKIKQEPKEKEDSLDSLWEFLAPTIFFKLIIGFILIRFIFIRLIFIFHFIFDL
jgi:hypothetical protein